MPVMIIDAYAQFRVPEYTSPYPQWSRLAAGGWEIPNPAAATRLFTKGYDLALKNAVADILSSPEVGGLREQIVNEIIWYDGEPYLDNLRGIFGAVPTMFIGRNDPREVMEAMGRVGADVATKALAGIPVVGWIAAAIVGIARFAYRLHRLSVKQSKVPELIVPWIEPAEPTDDQFIVNVVLQDIMRSGDWNRLFLPRLKLDNQWRIAKTEREGVNRSYGPYPTDRLASTTINLEGQYETNRVGSMPNTLFIADLVQIAEVYTGVLDRTDAVTNVGDYYPSVSQYAQSAWQFASRDGSADAYKINTGELLSAWEGYWSSYFSDGFDQIQFFLKKKGLSESDLISAMFIAKALGKFCTNGFGTSASIGVAGIDKWSAGAASAMTPEIFTKQNRFELGSPWGTPYDRVIEPSLRNLRSRQLSMLSRTTVCAYVRPVDVDDSRPAFAAFRNDRELREKCLEMRERLLDHPARYEVRPNDVEYVDPAYAQRLRDSQELVPPLPISALPPLEPDAPAVPPQLPPSGGVPFFVAVPGKKPPRPSGMTTGQKIALTGAVGGGAYLLYSQYGQGLPSPKQMLKSVQRRFRR